MILVVGERVNNPTISDVAVERWRDWWEEHSWDGVIAVPSSGGSLRRMKKLLGGRPYRVVNILPPDNRIGTWDRELAQRIAADAAPWTAYQEQYDSIVLLGRRVSGLFFPKSEFGYIGQIGKLPALCFPHPSGRSRWWNDKNAERRAKRWLKRLEILCSGT